MSRGAAQPALWRTAATVVGSSWMDAVFITTSRQSWSVARVASDGSRSRPAARMPMGVAALPSPRRLAVTFALRCPASSGSRRLWGKRNPRIGERTRASTAVIPTRSISFPRPAQRASGPAVATHSSTAWTAPLVRAAAVSAPRPVQMPKTAPHTTETAQNHPKIMRIPPIR